MSASPHVEGRRGNRDGFGAAVMVAYLAASPLVFARNAVDGFEQVKVWLLLSAVLAVAAFAPRLLDPRWSNGRGFPVPSTVALLYLGAAVLSTAFSTNPPTSLVGADESHSGLITVAATVGLFLVARRLCLRAVGWPLVAAVVVGSAGASAYAVVQALGADPLTWKRMAAFGGWSRPFGTMGHPNHLGALLAVTLPAQLGLVHAAFARGRRAAGVVLALGGALSAVALVATLSRAAFSAALVGLAVYLLFVLAGGRRRMALAAGAIVLTLALGMFLRHSPRGAGPFAGALRERVQRAVVIGPRLQIWRAALDVFRESPVLGSGLDTFALAFQRHRPSLYWVQEYDATPTQAHNEILHALATQGIVGGLAWCAVVLGAGWMGTRAVRRAQGVERGLASALLGGWVAFLVLALAGFAVVTITSTLAVWAAVLTGLAGDSGPPRDPPARAWPSSAWTAALAATVAFAVGLLSDEAPLGPGLAHAVAVLAAVSAVAAWTAWAAAKALADRPAMETGGKPSPDPAVHEPAPGAGLVAKGRSVAWIAAAVVAWVFLVLRPLCASLDARSAETATAAQEAVALLTQASRLDPLRVLYQRRLGLSMLKVDAPDAGERAAWLRRSRDVLARGVRLVPQDAYGWASLSMPETKLAAAGLLEKDQPFRSLDEALRRDPANVTFRLAGANAALELGDLGRARRYAGEAAGMLPDFAPAHAQLAHVAVREGRLDDAISLFEKALALQWYGQTEARHVAQANLAAVLIRAGRLPEAEQEARALALEDPSFAPGRYQHARALEALGHSAEAAAEYDATLRLDPSHRGAREALRRGTPPESHTR